MVENQAPKKNTHNKTTTKGNAVQRAVKKHGKNGETKNQEEKNGKKAKDK